MEDAFNIIEKYNLDSVKFLYRRIKDNNHMEKYLIDFHVNDKSKIVYGSSNVHKYNTKIFKSWGNIWNRIVRANIFIKGIYLLNDITLNIYKNAWDDMWFNTIVDKASYSFLIVERVAYVYFHSSEGEGSPKTTTDIQKDKYIRIHLGLLYFDYNMLPKNDRKSTIIKKLRKFNKKSYSPSLWNMKSKFYILNDLLKILIGDPYVKKKDKKFLTELLNESKNKEIILQMNSKA